MAINQANDTIIQPNGSHPRAAKTVKVAAPNKEPK